MQYVLAQVGVDQGLVFSFWARVLISLPIACLLLFPLSMKRDMSSLTFASIASILSLVYTLLVLLSESSFYYRQYKPQATIRACYLDWNILTSFSLVIFAYTCQLNLFPIYSELVAPNYRRIKKVIVRAISIDFVFYALIAVAGYASTFNKTGDVMIERDPLPNFNPDYAMLLAAISICIVLIAAFGLTYAPARN